MSRVRIKVCGMTRAQDVRLASDLGADAIGLIFYDKSPRSARLEDAANVVQAASAFVKVVAVVVDPSVDYMQQVLSAAPFDAIQFHGNESATFCEQFERPYIKALRMKEGINLDAKAREYASASGLLLDTYVEGTVGGTGQNFDWQRAGQVNDDRLILAGGLQANTLADAARQSGVFNLDLASTVEAEPGIKDEAKMQELFAVIHTMNCADRA